MGVVDPELADGYSHGYVFSIHRDVGASFAFASATPMRCHIDGDFWFWGAGRGVYCDEAPPTPLSK